MRKTLIVFLIMMLTRIGCFSSNTSTPTEPDSIVSVTASDIKYANLIFVEHKKLRVENECLYEQVSNLEELNIQNMRLDSLRVEQIGEYDKLTKSYATQIEQLNKDIKKKNVELKAWQIGGITVSVGLILFLLLK